MFPVRRELVGKRFAFIQGDGRTGTRKRGHHSGLSQNWNELSWVTGTILAANVDGLDTQDDSVVSKKVKLFVYYDSRYQLQKEWIKLYSGGHRIFFIEENLVLCRRKEAAGYSSQNYGWPALRMVPILDRNFMDENPHLIPVEYMGSRKQLSFIAFEDIIKLFPDEDQTLLFQSVQQNSYLKSDYQSWERTQKTQMILLYGPYSLTGCRVEVNDPSTGRCYRAVIISHDCMKRVLDVMDDQLLKSRKVNPKLIQVNFLASDEDIDKLMRGEAPKAIPTRYSRYGHQVQHSRCQLDDLGSSEPSSHFTLPQWMTNINFMGQDHSNQLPHDDYQKNSVPPSNKLSIAKNHCIEGEIDTSPIGSVDASDHGMPVSDFQNGVQKEGKLSMHFSPTQRIVSSEEMKKAPSAFSPEASDVSQHSTSRLQANIGPCLQHSPAVPLSNGNVQHFGSPSSSHLPVGGLDQHALDRPSSSPFVDTTRISRYPTSSPLISPKGQCYDAFPSPPTSLHNLEDNSTNPYMQLSCYQPSQRTRDVEQGPSTGLADIRHPITVERSFTGLERSTSLPKEFEMKVSPKLHSSSSLSPDGRQNQQEQKNGSQFGRLEVAGSERYFDDTIHHQPMHHQSTQNQSSNIDQGDLARFLNQLDACFNTPLRKPQQPPGVPDYIKSLTAASTAERLHSAEFAFTSIQKNPNFQKDAFSAYMQQRAAGHYPSYHTQDSRTFQEVFEQYLGRQISDKQGLVLQDFAAAPASYMTRSLSSDNVRVVPGQFPMSPPNGPPKKAKGRGRKKARSKDDTSRPSTEASKKVSSLLLSSRKERDTDGIVEDLGKASVSKYNKFNEVRKESQASSKELVSENLEEKKNSLTDIEKNVSAKERDDSIDNKDMTARVALAFAGFNHGHSLDNRSQDIVQNILEQKIPTGATWIENFRTELSDFEIASAKSQENAICGKKTLANAQLESIDRPPSPEFLPKRDRGTEAPEASKSDLEDDLSNVGDKNGNSVSSVNENLPNSVESYSEKRRTELINGSEVEQAKLKDVVDVSSSTDVVQREHGHKNDVEKQENKSENGVAECVNLSTAVGINYANKEDEARANTGLSKVPIASLPVVSLGFRAGNVSDVSKGQGSNAAKVVRNIYGRALYQRTQTGPNFSQQLRTDKILGSVSSCELMSELKPSSEPSHESLGIKPSSELSHESLGIKPSSELSHESLGLKPSSELSHESLGLKPSSEPSHESLGIKPSSELSHESLGIKPSSELSYESLGIKPSSELSHESLELKPSSESSLESLGLDPSSEPGHGSHGFKRSSEQSKGSHGLKSSLGLSQDSECATSEKICKDFASDSSVPGSGLREMLQAEKSRIDILIKAPAISSAQQSIKHASPCFLKKEPGSKIVSEKKVKIGESRTQKNICKHKRKPCVCELKMTVANLASNAPLSCKLSSTFQSLQRLANENAVLSRLPVISQGPKLPSGNTNSQVNLQRNERTSLLAEPSFKILERREIVEETKKLSSQQPEEPTNKLHEDAVVSNQTDSMTVGTNNLAFSNSFRYSRKSEPRSSEKCRHKRRPCRCDVEAAKELSAHIEFLKSSAPRELENSNTEIVSSNLEHSISQASDSPRVITYSTSSNNAMGHVYSVSGTNDAVNAGGHDSVSVESVDGNQKVSVLDESLPVAEEIPNMLCNLGSNKEQDVQSSPCLVSVSKSGTGVGLKEAELRSVVSNVEKIEGKISDFMTMNKEFQKAIVAKEKKVKSIKKCKHKRKPCKCDNASICTPEMKEDEARALLSVDRPKSLSADSFEGQETEDFKRKSLHDNFAKKADVLNKEVKYVESSVFGKNAVIVITSKSQAGVRHVIQRGDVAAKKVQGEVNKLKVLCSSAFPSSNTKNLHPDGDAFKEKERQVKVDCMDPEKLESSNRPSENIQSNQGDCTSSAYTIASEEGSANKERLMFSNDLNISDPLISCGRASCRDSDSVPLSKTDNASSVIVTGSSSRDSGSDIAVTNIKEKKDASCKVVVENLTTVNDESNSLVEESGSKDYANILQLNSTNLTEKSESDGTEEKDAKCLLLEEAACTEEDKINKEKLETTNEICNSREDIHMLDGQDSVDSRIHSEDFESNKASMCKQIIGIVRPRQETNAEYDSCEKKLKNDTDINEKQSVSSGIMMAKEMKTLDELRQPQGGSLPTSSESHNLSKLSAFPFSVQKKGNTSGELKQVTASNSVKISIPPNFTLPSNVLNAPGARFTARAKIACPEKNLEPFKDGPVSVSFDGGKTYTFANIVEIRNKQNIAVDSKKKVAESKQVSNQRKESKKEMPASIDAVLLTYSPSDVAEKDLAGKEGNALEKKAHLTTDSKRISEILWNTDNLSVEDGVESDVFEEKKGSLEAMKSESKVIGTPKELRRSSRFSVKNAFDKPNEETAEFENKIKLSCVESTAACSFSENGSNVKLLADSSSLKAEDGKERKVKPLAINLNNQLSTCVKRKKISQTRKDEMFDCCAIHKNLFCKKCLPFKAKEGSWPASSRAKEINSAWRIFVRKCERHDCSRCSECSEIPYEAFRTRVLDTGDDGQKGKCYLAVRNEEDVAQTHSEESELGAQKINDNDNDYVISNNPRSIMQHSVDNPIENEAEKIQVASKVDDMDTKFEIKCEEKKTCVKESLDKRSRKERKARTVKYQKKLASKEPDVSNDEIGAAETSKRETTVLMVDSSGGGKSKTERNDDSDRVKITNSQSQNRSWKEAQDVMKQEPESNGEQNSRRKVKHNKIKFEKDEESRKVEGYSTVQKEREIPPEKGPDNSGNQRCLVLSEKQNPCQTPNVPTLHEESAVIQKGSEQSSNNVASQCNVSSEALLPKKRKALETTENKSLEMRTDEKSTENSDPSSKCLIHGRKSCGACKPFFENEGVWPGWARRGEVHYLWESKSEDRRNFQTVKCRIHLKAKCPRCLPFKDEDGIWPSWLERHTIEDHYSKFSQTSSNETNADGNFAKENICKLHKRYYCLRCYELKMKTGKWPMNDHFVERAERKRQKGKAKALASWNMCEIHEERICLPCFCFWKKEGRAPYDSDKNVVNRLWKTMASQISHYFCDVHKKRLCKSCTPIFLSEGKFPGRENHLQSIYSWKLFKDLLKQYSIKKLMNRKERSIKKKNVKGGSSNEFRSNESIKLVEKMIKSSKKILDKFHCTLHELFPCFACMPKFVKDSCWPNESDYDELWQNWTSEHPDEKNCAEHGHLFCKECHGIRFLFDKFKKPGITDVFLDMVAKCSGSVEVPKRKYRKRKLEKSDGNDGIDLHYCNRDEKISVSSKGRIRSKVLRPGTVDISKLEEVFIEKKTGSLLEMVDNGQAQNEKVKGWTKVNKRLKEEPTVAGSAEPVKRKRGRPRKKPLEPEEPAPKKRRGRKRKFGLVEQVRSGSLKIINVDDLRDQLDAEHERDPSPSHMEYVQLLDSAEKMNVKYFAISADCDNVIGKEEKNKEKLKIAVPESMDKVDDRKSEKDGSRKSVQKEDSIEKRQIRKGAVSLKEMKTPAKLSSMPMWSENDIELILQKVEKAALAAKAKKEEALHKRKQRQGKKPLTVAQVLAIKRKRGGDTRPVMDEHAREDLENMLKEAERRSVDLDTLLEEAIKTKDKEERRKQIAKQKAMEKIETFLQDKPCDQTPKLPKCRDCRIADKRNADQNAFCRFVMLRRLFKRPKTCKIESAGFCSPTSADQNAFIPWSSISSEVDMKASVCHYIIKNIAGQFCAVVEEECLALMLGTKDGAVAWKRAVAGVREMCDACATTVFNIHWVCEKCGFGVCLDCFKSKISENELKGEGYRSFEFNWSACAPGLSHKPTNLTVTQIIPKNALWDLCLQTVDICESLSIPFKLSENVLKKSMPLDHDSSSCQEHGVPDLSSERATSENQKVCDENAKDSYCKGLPPSSISVAPLNYSSTSPLDVEASNEAVLGGAVTRFTSFASNRCSALGDGVEMKFKNEEEIGETMTNAHGGSGGVLAEKEGTKEMQRPENKVFDSLPSSNSSANALGTKSTQLNSTGPLLGQLHHCSCASSESAGKSRDGEDLYYRNACETSLSVLDKIKKWKDASKRMVDEGDVNVGDWCTELWSSDAKQTDMMTAMNFENDSLLSDVSMTSDDAQLVGSHVKADLVAETNSSTADNSIGNTAPQDVPTVNDAHDSNLVDSPNKHFSPQYQNSLDILAMVATGFGISSNNEIPKCTEEEIASCNFRSENQTSPVVDDRTKENCDSVSEIDGPNLMVEESKFLGDQHPIASYLCDGQLLQLKYSKHPKNTELFRRVWKKGFPLLVSGVTDVLDNQLWKPESFAADFGDEHADVVNCLTGDILHHFPVGEFWKGFESIKDRRTDSNGIPMLLKLKDWPPGADFLDKMPKRFDDLMKAIPLPEYTRRDGPLNLVSRLPTNHFIKPDLGPKMYNAYGSAASPSAGTTNLHLDMSDAVNVMVYVGVPRDPLLGEQEIKDALMTVDMACCEKTKQRVRQPNVLPGALWHIYAAEDADKIRMFLRKVAEERKLKYSVHNDPIHDQSFYLDYDMRKRLKAEYGVTGFAICQCLGDAVFIPAGAPHQVLNLHSCVKVAEDFVSPERIGQCFNLTQEFRYLSDRHTNHEDKLQIKNIIYHAVKDSIAVLKES